VREGGPRFIPAEEVGRLLSMGACIEAVEEAFRSLARGEADQPLRTPVRAPGGGTEGGSGTGNTLLVMPGYLGSPQVLGAKLLTLFPGNHGQGFPSHQGVIVTFDPETGAPQAVVDAGPVTAIRTAAASAVATRLLARSDADELAVLGSGVQARTHVEAMRAVRPIRRIRAWSPNRERLRAFVDEMAALHGISAEASPSPRACVEGAAVVCTVTSSPEPVLAGEWLTPGTHVNAVGAHTPHTRELDTLAVTRSRFYVDLRSSALAEAGDFLIPRDEGAVGDDHIVGEIGEVLEGRAPGRTDGDQVTVFKSLGLAVQDLAAVGVMLGDA
jgi:alanine dehydrogenase